MQRAYLRWALKRSSWAPRRRRLDQQKQQLGFAVSASLLGIVTSYVTFDALGFRQVAGLTFLFMGMAGAIHHLTRVSATASPASRPAAATGSAATRRPARGR